MFHRLVCREVVVRDATSMWLPRMTAAINVGGGAIAEGYIDKLKVYLVFSLHHAMNHVAPRPNPKAPNECPPLGPMHANPHKPCTTSYRPLFVVCRALPWLLY
jgi:hypothetical protein